MTSSIKLKKNLNKIIIYDIEKRDLFYLIYGQVLLVFVFANTNFFFVLT